jgi:hypothetical protein
MDSRTGFDLLNLQGIEPRFFTHTALGLFTMSTELSRLHFQLAVVKMIGFEKVPLSTRDVCFKMNSFDTKHVLKLFGCSCNAVGKCYVTD